MKKKTLEGFSCTKSTLKMHGFTKKALEKIFYKKKLYEWHFYKKKTLSRQLRKPLMSLTRVKVRTYGLDP